MSPQPMNEYQQQVLDGMRRQQDAYLAAVRAWRKAAGPSAGFGFGQMPEMPTMPSADNWPSVEQIAESNEAFMTRLMEEQQRFFESLNDILGSGK